MLNRSITPAIGKPNPNNIAEPKQLEVNGLPLYFFRVPGSNVVQLDFVFPSGVLHQNAPLVSAFAFSLLLKGTKEKSGEQIMDELDSLGAYINESVSINHTRLTVYCLSSVFNQVLSVLIPAIRQANYSEKELEIKKNKGLNQLKINNSKTNYNAKKRFNELIYGSQSPLGHKLTESDYKHISRETLIEYHNNHICLDDIYIVVSCDSESNVDGLYNHLNKVEKETARVNDSFSLIHSSTSDAELETVHVENAVQASVYIGKQTINCHHEDYNKLWFVNTLLGGYFGSRLMANIREEKGLTYGIHSSLISQEDVGLFQISSDVKEGMHSLCVTEIDKEIKLLQSEKVSLVELNKVKNYLLGILSKTNSDPTSYNTNFIGLKSKGLNYSFLREKIDAINKITVDDVLRLSNTYLQTNTLTKVAALNTK